MEAATCWETRDRARALSAREKRDTAIAAAIHSLSSQFLDAVKAPDLSKVMLPTPEFGDKLGGDTELSALNLIHDMLADADGDAMLQSLVHLVAAASRGEPVQLQCQTLLARMAGAYAGYHGAKHALGEGA